MTRKTYYHKTMQLVLAINKKHGLGNVGKALTHLRDSHKDAPNGFGSYQKAWDSEAMKFARRYYLGEER